jgi:type IV conjugative transfer system protein TraL
MSREQFFIPQHLDDAPRFLFWSVDEAMSVIVPLGFGIILGLKFFITPVLAFASFKGWKKLKGSGGNGVLRAMMYWYYPGSFVGMKALPDSSVKIFIA